MSVVVLIIIVLLILGVFSGPYWPYSRGWGWYPSGGLGLLVVILLILLLTGRL